MGGRQKRAETPKRMSWCEEFPEVRREMTTSVLARRNFETPLRRRRGVGVSNRKGVRAESGWSHWLALAGSSVDGAKLS